MWRSAISRRRSRCRAPALQTAGIDRCDRPVVGVRAESGRDRERGGRDLERLAGIGHGVPGELRILRDRDLVLDRMRRRRPAHHERHGRVGDLGAAPRGQQLRLVRPLLADLAHARPAAGSLVGVDRAHPPVVVAVEERLVDRCGGVERVERRQVRAEAGVRRELELVASGARTRRHEKAGMAPTEALSQARRAPVARPRSRSHAPAHRDRSPPRRRRQCRPRPGRKGKHDEAPPASQTVARDERRHGHDSTIGRPRDSLPRPKV